MDFVSVILALETSSSQNSSAVEDAKMIYRLEQSLREHGKPTVA